MLKETVSYKDFDDNPVTEVLYFNLTKTELVDQIPLKDRLERLEKILKGEERELTESEVQEILDLVKTLMRLSYGVRSDDGRRFIKSEEVWTEFTQTMAYDTFLFGLFEDPVKAVNFMTGILPQELREKAEEAVKNGAIPQYQTPETPIPETAVPINDLQKAPKDMSREELLEAYQERLKNG